VIESSHLASLASSSTTVMGVSSKICNIFFVLVLLLFAVGTIMFHAGVASMVPAVKYLPENLLKGFGEVFKFDYLRQDSINVKTGAAAAVAKCNAYDAGVSTTSSIQATTYCSHSPTDMVTRMIYTDPNTGATTHANAASVDATSEKIKIETAFGSSLTVIQTVSNDQYFGTPEMQETASQLNNITVEMAKINNSMQCPELVPAYCAIYIASAAMEEGVAKVESEINKFKNSKEMDMFNDNSSKLDMLNILPYIIVLALLFYSCFWFKGGVCCCCNGGNCGKTLLLVPNVLFCLIFFVVITVFVFAGIAWNEVVYPDVKITSMKNEPTVEQLLVHIHTKFPDFWTIVFKDLEAGLKAFFGASCVMWASVVAITVYEIAVCIVRPYSPKDAAAELVKDGAVEKPKDEEIYEASV
jgi:hypothetical protein